MLELTIATGQLIKVFGRGHVGRYGNELLQPHRYRTASAVFALLQQRHIDSDDQELRLDED